MRNQSSVQSKSNENLQLKQVFGSWVHDRLLLATFNVLIFVLWDSIFTYLGTQYWGVTEANLFVHTLTGLDHGWTVWLGLKVAYVIFGTTVFFLVYYFVTTSRMTDEDKQGLLRLELCGWVYLISFSVFSLFTWSGVLLAKL